MTLRFDGTKRQDRIDALRDGWIEIIPPHGEPLKMAEYRKTATTYAVKMPDAFEVDTLEGLHSGKPGDYLAVGAHGEMYPIDAAVFEATYELVE